MVLVEAAAVRLVELQDHLAADLRQLGRNEQHRVVVEVVDDIAPAPVVDGRVVAVHQRLRRGRVGLGLRRNRRGSPVDLSHFSLPSWFDINLTFGWLGINQTESPRSRPPDLLHL